MRGSGSWWRQGRLWVLPVVGMVVGVVVTLAVVWLSDVPAAPRAFASLLTWLNTWVLSPGFGTVAAVVAAFFAFTGAAVGASTQRENAARDRWWDQVKWACDRLGGNDLEQSTALMVLLHFAAAAPGRAEADFVADLMASVIGIDDGDERSAVLDAEDVAGQTGDESRGE